MITVASRDLRNHTADVLRRVSEGERVGITVHGELVAELSPVRAQRPRALVRDQALELLGRHQADAALRLDLAWISGDTTDELGPIT
jgi:prevent-host-death family protein